MWFKSVSVRPIEGSIDETAPTQEPSIQGAFVNRRPKGGIIFPSFREAFGFADFVVDADAFIEENVILKIGYGLKVISLLNYWNSWKPQTTEISK